MTAMFKVQSGVPRPPVDRRAKVPRRKFPVETMAVDDMFFLPGRTGKSVSAYVSRITKHLPGKYTTQRCSMWQDQRDGKWHPAKSGDVGMVEGVGVWRIE